MNSNIIKCIALDLDRTTLRSDGTLSMRTKDVLQRAVQKEMKVIIASGRPYTALPPAILNLDGIQYAITSNGAAIYEVPTGRRCYAQLLPADEVEKILLRYQDTSFSFEAFVDGQGYVDQSLWEDPTRYGMSSDNFSYIQHNRIPVPDIRSFLKEHKHEMDSMDLVVPEEKICRRVMEEIKQMSKEVYVTSSSVNLVELSNRKCGKHQGLKVLMDWLEIERMELAAFGDAENDIDMIELAGVGVAMANASVNCKKAADYITLSNDEDGVAVFLENYL